MSRRHRCIVFLAVAACSLLVAPSAHAAFPGANGKIVFDDYEVGAIYTINADGSGEALLAVKAQAPAWSPDGKKVTFVSILNPSDYEISVVDADGTNRTPLTNTSFQQWPAWSPDGTKIVFGSIRDGNPELYSMNADGSDPIRLTNYAGVDSSPAWSPDGGKIAFVSDRDDTSGIYTMNPDGTGVTLIASDGRSPNWSPDGSKIAFNVANETDLHFVNRDGSGRTTIPAGGGLFDFPVWAPDGSKLVSWMADDSGEWLSVLNSDGTGITNLRPAPIDGVKPDWQPIPLNYARPKGATPAQIYLVPAYNPCTAPNRTHGAPLAFGSCDPPTQTSSHLTIGSPDANGAGAKSLAKVFYATKVGNPSTAADEADVDLTVTISDVRNTSDLSDYTGELSIVSDLQITDRDNTPYPGGPGPGTLQNTSLPVTVSCAPTPDTTIGSTCNLQTTLDTLYPGAVKEGRRSVWQLGQVRAYDGGTDGLASTTGDNTLFLTQGIFIP